MNAVSAWMGLSADVAGHEGVLLALIEELEPSSYVRERLIEQVAKLESARREAREKVVTA